MSNKVPYAHVRCEITDAGTGRVYGFETNYTLSYYYGHEDKEFISIISTLGLIETLSKEVIFRQWEGIILRHKGKIMRDFEAVLDEAFRKCFTTDFLDKLYEIRVAHEKLLKRQTSKEQRKAYIDRTMGKQYIDSSGRMISLGDAIKEELGVDEMGNPLKRR